MSYNIIEEANNKLKDEKLNLGNLMTMYADIKDDDGVSRSYETLTLDLLSKYYLLLFSNIETMDYMPTLKYKPEYVSYYVYGTASLDYLVLYANGIGNKKDFTRENLGSKIKYFNKEILSKIEDEVVSNKNLIGKTIKVENYLLYKI